MHEIPESISSYYEEKKRDAPCKIAAGAEEMRNLDNLVREQLYGTEEVSSEQIEEAIRAVINAPGSTWRDEVIRYRLRVLHYS